MVWPSAVRLVAAKLTSEVVCAALGGGGNAALSSRVTPWSGGTALSGSVALGGTLGSSGALGD